MEEHPGTDEYLRPTPDQQIDRFLISAIADLIVPRLHGKRVLELGIGHGVWTPRLLKRFPSVVSVDWSPTLLERARGEITSPHWSGVCCTFEEFAPESPFDVVMATYVLEHVKDPLALLACIRGWLAPGGEAVVIVPNAASLHRRLAVIMGIIEQITVLGEADRRLQHHHCFRCEELERLLASVGFVVREKFGLLAKTFPNAFLVHCMPEQLRCLVHLGLQLPMDMAAALYYRVGV